jgi:purine-nucleoside phosphorylase
MHQNLRATTDFINKKTSNFEPEIGIVLGTGLGGLVEDIEIHHSLMYANIPDFPISTLEFHSGKLIFGMLGGKRVVAMQGRLHYYEGYDMKQITFPVRVMKMLGIQKLFISNASGALNPEYRKGDLMIINDHINMQSDNPLRGKNTDSLGPRFPDMSEPYDRKMIEMGMQIALKNNIRCHSGVYVSVNGPNLETRAEYRFLRFYDYKIHKRNYLINVRKILDTVVFGHNEAKLTNLSKKTKEGIQGIINNYIASNYSSAYNEFKKLVKVFD